jgi:hypothetical protein
LGKHARLNIETNREIHTRTDNVEQTKSSEILITTPLRTIILRENDVELSIARLGEANWSLSARGEAIILQFVTRTVTDSIGRLSHSLNEEKCLHRSDPIAEFNQE